MGVYIFESKHANWIKVGHHKITTQRPNVYYRVANRGFWSCKHPPELKDHLACNDFNLIAWFPDLDRNYEMFIHSNFPEKCGEFHLKENLQNILKYLESHGKQETVSESALEEASMHKRSKK